jgi:hypothetical protein
MVLPVSPVVLAVPPVLPAELAQAQGSCRNPLNQIPTHIPIAMKILFSLLNTSFNYLLTGPLHNAKSAQKVRQNQVM